MKTIVLIGDKQTSAEFIAGLEDYRLGKSSNYEINGQSLKVYQANVADVLKGKQSAVIAFENASIQIVNQTARLPSDTLYFYHDKQVKPCEFLQSFIRKIKPCVKPSVTQSFCTLFGIKPKTKQPVMVGGLDFRKHYGQ